MIITWQYSPSSGEGFLADVGFGHTTCFDHWEMMQPAPGEGLRGHCMGESGYAFNPVKQHIPSEG